jgi:hypothetical protein
LLQVRLFLIVADLQDIPLQNNRQCLHINDRFHLVLAMFGLMEIGDGMVADMLTETAIGQDHEVIAFGLPAHGYIQAKDIIGDAVIGEDNKY